MKLFVALLLALATCLGCTPAQRATAERDIATALTVENIACLLGSHVPGDSPDTHAAIVTACGIIPDLADATQSLLKEADARHAASDAGKP